MSIRWFGGVALVAAAGITALLATAQASDRIVEVRQQELNISGANKTALGNAADSLFPGIVKANTFALRCLRRPTALRCFAKESNTGTAAEYFADRDNAAYSVELDSWNGSAATWTTTHKNTSPSGAQQTALGTFLAGLWPSAVLANVTALDCARDPDDATVIDCTLLELQTKTEADALTALSNNPGSKVVGVVQ